MKKGSKTGILTTMFISMICISAFVMGIFNFNKNQLSLETTLVKSFHTSGAEVMSSELYFTGKVEERKSGILDKKAYILKLAEKMEVLKDDGWILNLTKNDEIEKIEASGVTKSNIAVTIHMLLNQKDSTAKPEISVSMTQYGSTTGLDSIRKKTLSILRKNNVNPKVNVCIIGRINGKYSASEQNEICEKVFEEIGATKINTVKADQFVSVEAYSQSMETSIQTGEEKTNINVAMRYNSLEDKTYIWLATPVITVEY